MIYVRSYTVSCFVVMVLFFSQSILFIVKPSHAAEYSRILPQGTLPADSRIAPPRTVDSYHPFQPVDSPAAWELRREEIRQRILVGAGLWPMPAKTPLNSSMYGTIDRGDYTVEKVSFESIPGHFVTGSLYRPKTPKPEKGYPGVLCPHGHWADGRFYDSGEKQSLNEIAHGSERFLCGARSPLQARCVQLARMGCIVFHYDMLGNADSIQFPEHRHGPRESLDGHSLGTWGFASQEGAARLQTNFGLQTLNSIRSLDFLLERGDVDPAKLLVTGASGGGTQTMILSAIDPRVTASFPCVMVSTSMQGGCTCENTHLLRVGQGNIEIAAASAPRPMGMTAADDWTKELKTKGWPDIDRIYEMVKAKGMAEAHFDIHFPHNYNHVSRTHMYQFANRHLSLGLPTPVLEREFEKLSREELSVWDASHPRPSGDAVGETHERAICRLWTDDSSKQIDPLLQPDNSESLATSREVLGGAWDVLIRRSLPTSDAIDFSLVSKTKETTHLILKGLVRNTKHKEEIPTLFLHPEKANGRVVLWLSSQGKAGLFDGGVLRPEVKRLLGGGISVMAADLYGQGEFISDHSMTLANPQVHYPGPNEKPEDSWRRDSVYYYGYNDSLYARRVHDVLTLIAFAKCQENYPAREVSLVALADAGHWASAARAVNPSAVDRAVIDVHGFRFGNLSTVWHADFQPGAVKYGDITGLLTLGAPGQLMLADPDPQLRDRVTKTYQAAGKSNALKVSETFSTDGADWISFLLQ